MTQIKYLISTIIFYSTISIYAIDINNTTEIIKEASKATEKLQKEFSNLIETKETINSTTTEQNITVKKAIVIEDSIKNIAEENITIEESIVVEDSNETIHKIKKEITTKERNETIQDKLEITPKIVVDNNISIVENNTSENNISIVENNITTLLEMNSSKKENQTVVSDNITEDDEGSSKKGMIIFKTKLKKICKMTGEEFAKNYTQEDWDDIYDNDEFEKVVYELCPDIKGKYDINWTKDLYQFSLQYASDTDEIPEC